MTAVPSFVDAAPGPVDVSIFKDVMRRLASGVAVVTSGGDGVFAGLTATAICSVSAEPPLVLATLNRSSRTHGVIRRTGVFAINLLDEGQEDLAVRFAATSGKSADAAAHRPGVTGSPLLDGCHATIECLLHCAHDVGTHTIFVGLVVSSAVGPSRPLVYHAGDFAGLAQRAPRPGGPRGR